MLRNIDSESATSESWTMMAVNASRSIDFTLMLAILCLSVLSGCDGLTKTEEANLEKLALSIQAKGEATRKFNAITDGVSGFATIQSRTVDELVDMYQSALNLSNAVDSDVLLKVHPELDRMIHDLYEPALVQKIKCLQEGDMAASLAAQYLDSRFADWWDAHRGDMPLLKQAMNRIQGE